MNCIFTNFYCLTTYVKAAFGIAPSKQQSLKVLIFLSTITVICSCRQNESCLHHEMHPTTATMSISVREGEMRTPWLHKSVLHTHLSTKHKHKYT